jgi:hypothetical protein
LPSVAHAQRPDEDDDVIIRINGDVTVAAGETVDGVVVISANAIIEGTVNEFVLVIDGNAVISGTVGEHVTSIEGDVILEDGASVNDVSTYSGDLQRAAGADVSGDITDRDGFALSGTDVFFISAYFWLAMTVIALVAGLVFAAIGGAQLTRAALVMTGQFVNSLIGTVVLWIGVPILAVVIMFTLIGIPLGLGVLLFVLPVLWFLGYIVAGTRLGLAIVRRMNREPGTKPLLAAFIGILVLQLVALIPIFGWLIAAIAGLWGGGALAYTAFAAAGGKSFEGTPTQPTTSPTA